MCFGFESGHDRFMTRFDRRDLAVRVGVAVLVVGYFIGGFHLVAALATHGPVHTLRTPVDDAIPLVPWTVYLYSWVYTSALYPLFVVRGHKLFRRTVIAYLSVFTAAFATFVVFPVTSIGLRPDPRILDDRVFHEWGLHLTYVADPPYNLFPSLHLSIACIAMLAAARASYRLAALAAPVVVAIAITICTTKQHFVADGLGAVVLSAIVDRLVLAPYRREDDPSPRTFGAKGPLLYLLFHASVYGAFYLLFRSGFRPWVNM